MSTPISNVIEKKETFTGNNSNNNNSINWKSYGILAILYLLITSDIFTENILSIISGTIDGREVTCKGAIISAIILVIAHILIMHNLGN